MGAGPAVLKFPRGLPPAKQFGERLRLLVLQGPEQGACYSLLADSLFIGREGCQISLKDENASKRHAELLFQDETYVVKDLGSANGILVNGEKVSSAVLKAGDLLLVGLTLMEVYPAGRAIRTEKPLLPAHMVQRRAAAANPAAPAPAAAPSKAAPLSPEALKKKRATDKKRLFIFVGIFLVLFVLYFGTDQSQTIREAARIESSEPEVKGKPKKRLKKEEIQEALAEVTPQYALDNQQRKDAEVFFRNGVRELTNKNFRRAFTAFETALTVDPSHELAKVYLKTAKIEMINELKTMNNAAVQAQKSLRYREARMNYDNIIRYLKGEDDGKDLLRYQDNEVLKASKKSDKKEASIPEMYEAAQNAIKELDKLENKVP